MNQNTVKNRMVKTLFFIKPEKKPEKKRLDL